MNVRFQNSNSEFKYQILNQISFLKLNKNFKIEMSISEFK